MATEPEMILYEIVLRAPSTSDMERYGNDLESHYHDFKYGMLLTLGRESYRYHAKITPSKRGVSNSNDNMFKACDCEEDMAPMVIDMLKEYDDCYRDCPKFGTICLKQLDLDVLSTHIPFFKQDYAQFGITKKHMDWEWATFDYLRKVPDGDGSYINIYSSLSIGRHPNKKISYSYASNIYLNDIKIGSVEKEIKENSKLLISNKAEDTIREAYESFDGLQGELKEEVIEQSVNFIHTGRIKLL